MNIAREFIQLNGNYELGLECGMWTNGNRNEHITAIAIKMEIPLNACWWLYEYVNIGYQNIKMLLHEKCTSLGGKKERTKVIKISSLSKWDKWQEYVHSFYATFNGHHFGSGIWCAEQIHASHDNHTNQPIHRKSS